MLGDGMVWRLCMGIVIVLIPETNHRLPIIGLTATILGVFCEKIDKSQNKKIVLQKQTERKNYAENTPSSSKELGTMAPTIALKYRLENDTKHEFIESPPSLASSFSFESEGSAAPTSAGRTPAEDEAARLLLSVSTIVSRELSENGSVFDDNDGPNYSSPPPSPGGRGALTSLLSTHSPSSGEESFTWNRVRTVSIDSPLAGGSPNHSKASNPNMTDAAVVSPSNTPVTRGRPVRKASARLLHKPKKVEHLRLPKMPTLRSAAVSKVQRRKALQACAAKGMPIKKILRKKFSWKNYPG